MTRNILFIGAATLASITVSLAQANDFTYQGRLSDSGAPFTGSAEFQPTLWTAESGGSQVGTNTPSTVVVGVTNGLFVLPLDFGTAPFATGAERWLQLEVRTTIGPMFPLSSRQKLTATPYALTAAKAVAVSGGSISDPIFLGTTTPAPLELQVNNVPGLRLEYPTSGAVPNLVGGYSGNTVGSGTEGAVIAGGGSSGAGVANSIGANSDYSVIAGGYANQIDTNAAYGTISGGNGNDIHESSGHATIGGGGGHDIRPNAPYGTVGGGYDNDIGANSGYGTIAGGSGNDIAANSLHGTIPGGRLNFATNHAFAAGTRAKANHAGAFVWGDSTDADFASWGANMFLFRASGGVAINTDDPSGAALRVNGAVAATSFSGNGAALTGINADLLDGLDSTAFVRSSGPTTISGNSSASATLTVTQSGPQNGILATTASTDSGEAAVVGRAGSAGPAITGVAGVWGNSSSGRGVIGSSSSNDGVFGFSSTSRGVVGQSPSGNGVEGQALAVSGEHYGVRGESSSSTAGAGVRGDGEYLGVWGESSGRWGVYGRSTGTSSSYGVFGSVSAGTGNYAGYFNGNVYVSGTLAKGGGSFKIDHPLDPQNKYLSHSFVESPDMMNVYNGNVTLDESGAARVSLPAYFEALNRDFRYQLTAVGGPGPNLHIAQPIHNNAFRIAGGSPGLQVSWQVTGIRQDAFANANRIPVEEDKPAEEQGTYLHPEALGHPMAKGLEQNRHPDFPGRVPPKS